MSDLPSNLREIQAAPPLGAAKAKVAFRMYEPLDSDTDAAGATKPEPAAMNFNQWPVLNSMAARGVIGRAMRLATARSEADPVAVMIQTLTQAGAALGRHRYIMLGDQRQHSRHYSAVVGQSALARKGTSYSSVERIFAAADDILLAAGVQPPQVTGGPLSSAEGIIWAIRDPSEETDENGVPKDAGVEDKRLLIVEEELSAVLRVGKRAGNLVSALMRRAFDGGTLRPLTKNNRICATQPHINIIGHITIQELMECLKDCSVEIWNGFANRFLWLLVRRSKVVSRPMPMPNEGVQEIAQDIAGALQWAQENPGEVRIPNNTWAHWALIYPELTQEYASVITSMLARLPTHCWRLALTYAQLDRSSVITIEHLEAAMAVCRYAKDSILYMFEQEDADPVADAILDGLEKAGEAGLTLTEISALFDRHAPAASIRATVKRLEERKAIRTEQPKRQPGQKGALTTRVFLNQSAK